MKESRIDKNILSFITKIRSIYPDAKIILFGSRARGDELKTSDYDFIVVSNAFKGIPFFERPVLLYELWEGGAIDLLCYTPEEFERKKEQISIVRKAVEEGFLL